MKIPPDNFPRFGEWLLASGVTAAVLALQIYLLVHAGGFCGDEVQVINLAATHSLPAMTHDSFPVLLPLLVSGWSAVGLAQSDFQLRWLGMLIALGIVLAFWLAALTARRAPPLFSLILFGLNSFAIFWENYLRAYGLGSLLILLTVAAMIWFLAKPAWNRTVILTIVAILSVQALFHNAVFFAAICFGGWMVCWLRKNKNAALKILVTALLAAASLLPYWNCIMRWRTGTAAIRPGFSFAAAADNLHTILAFPISLSAWVWGFFTVGVIVAGIFTFFKTDRVPGLSGPMTLVELRTFAATTLIFSIGGYLIFLCIAAMITSPWYFLPLMVIAVICFDLAVPTETFPRLPGLVVLAILLATIGISIPFAVRDLNCRFTNADVIAKRLSNEASPEDFIVVTPWHLGISFNRYYHGAAAWDTLPPLGDHSTYRFDLLPPADKTKAANQPVIDKIASTLRNGHRVWIVGWMTVPPPGKRAYSETAQFIADHSLSFKEMPLHFSQAINDYENESLLMADGWKEKTETISR